MELAGGSTIVQRVPTRGNDLDQAIELGFERVLTSGAQPLAPDGVALIAQMVLRAAGRISVMPGCGLTADNVTNVIAITGAQEVHAACSVRIPGELAFSDFDPPGGRFETSETQVREMVSRISG